MVMNWRKLTKANMLCVSLLEYS